MYCSNLWIIFKLCHLPTLRKMSSRLAPGWQNWTLPMILWSAPVAWVASHLMYVSVVGPRMICMWEYCTWRFIDERLWHFRMELFFHVFCCLLLRLFPPLLLLPSVLLLLLLFLPLLLLHHHQHPESHPHPQLYQQHRQQQRQQQQYEDSKQPVAALRLYCHESLWVCNYRTTPQPPPPACSSQAKPKPFWIAQDCSAPI